MQNAQSFKKLAFSSVRKGLVGAGLALALVGCSDSDSDSGGNGGGGGFAPSIQIAAGGKYVVALKYGGVLYATGDNSNGQLGVGHASTRYYPTLVSSLLGVASDLVTTISGTNAYVAAGDSHTLVVSATGDLYSAGDNHFGQLGLGNSWEYNEYNFTKATTFDATTDSTGVFNPVIYNPPVFKKAAAGLNHSVAIDSQGGLWVAGSNAYGQLGVVNTGVGSNGIRPVFTKLAITTSAYFSEANGTAATPAANFQAIAAGDNHTLVVANGQIWGAGAYSSGQLGFSTVGGSSNQGGKFVKALDFNDTTNGFDAGSFIVSGTTPIQAVAAGEAHSVALDSQGNIWTTGDNSNGQLGLGAGLTPNRFTKVSLFNGGVDYKNAPKPVFKAIAAGKNHTVAVDVNGSLWTVGANESAQLGLNDGDEDRYIFTKVTFNGQDLPIFVDVAAGDDYTVAIDASGRAWVAGSNAHGQLGFGKYSDTAGYYDINLEFTPSPL
ncbi:MAG: hypothetical protein LBQ52_07635 [Helicobacteraceae bacterium]|jgi:alpha-tubulin suppressor-like RCC1 family protein|nr:hypothetical protein [Helicobacteraceae bacterium]